MTLDLIKLPSVLFQIFMLISTYYTTSKSTLVNKSDSYRDGVVDNKNEYLKKKVVIFSKTYFMLAVLLSFLHNKLLYTATRVVSNTTLCKLHVLIS